MPETTRWALPYPDLDATADVPLDIYNLALALDGVAMHDQGLADSRPVSTAENPGLKGRIYHSLDTGLVDLDYGTGWITLNAPKSIREGKTWAIRDEIFVPSGDQDYIPPLFTSFASGQTKALTKARYRINSGGSVTCKLQRKVAGGTLADIPGFTGMIVTTTDGESDPPDVPLNDNDEIALVVTAVAGNPENMSFTVFLDSLV